MNSSIDDLAIEDVNCSIALGDDFNGIPAVTLKFTSEMLLVGDPFAPQHPGFAPFFRVFIRGHLLAARRRVDPGVDRETVKGDQITDVGLLDLILERRGQTASGPRMW